MKCKCHGPLLQRCVYVTCLWQFTATATRSICETKYTRFWRQLNFFFFFLVALLPQFATTDVKYFGSWQLAEQLLAGALILIALRLPSDGVGFFFCFSRKIAIWVGVNESMNRFGERDSHESPYGQQFHFAPVADFPKHRACQFVWVYCTHCSGYDLGKRPGGGEGGSGALPCPAHMSICCWQKLCPSILWFYYLWLLRQALWLRLS